MKQIDGFTDYFARADGKIVSTKKKGLRVLVTWLSHDGYELVHLCREGKAVSRSVARLVAQTLIPNPDNLPQVNHINGIKTDNRIRNLEWCTASRNSIHAYGVLGRMSSGRVVVGVKQITLSGEVVAEFRSANEAEKTTGIGRNVIIAVCKQKKCRKTAGGFRWEFVN
jgi:hypothetical protein